VSEARPESVSATVRVADALADATDTDSRSLDPPLATAVDPDALDALAASDADTRVEFAYGDHWVVVDGDTVTVTQPATATPTPPGSDDDD
jgi:hypothetical protein